MTSLITNRTLEDFSIWTGIIKPLAFPFISRRVIADVCFQRTLLSLILSKGFRKSVG